MSSVIGTCLTQVAEVNALHTGLANLFITTKSIKRKPAEAGSGCFGYKVSPTSEIMPLGQKPHRLLLLQLLFLLDCPRCSYPRDGSRSESCVGVRLPCCPLCYSLPCRNHDWPIIKRLLPSFLCDPVLNSLNAPSGPFWNSKQLLTTWCNKSVITFNAH